MESFEVGPASDIEDIDPEVVELVDAINSFPGIRTLDSCCGHNHLPMCIYFDAEELAALPPLLYWFDACHSGEYWPVRAFTDCSAGPLRFVASSEPRMGKWAYDSARKVARAMQNRARP